MIVLIKHKIYRDRITNIWRCVCDRFRIDGTGYTMVVMESETWESLRAPLDTHLKVCGHV